MTALYYLHWLAGIVVLAEALNKLQRADLFDAGSGHPYPRLRCLSMVFRPWLWSVPYAILTIKTVAWFLLAICAGYAVMRPLMHISVPDPEDVAGLTGFALLIMRSRLREAYLLRRQYAMLRRTISDEPISSKAPLGED